MFKRKEMQVICCDHCSNEIGWSGSGSFTGLIVMDQLDGHHNAGPYHLCNWDCLRLLSGKFVRIERDKT